MLQISENPTNEVIKDEQFYSIRTLKNPTLARTLARVLLVITAIILVSLFLPWQQNIRGTGTLSAIRPENRSQTIHSAIAGRIQKWHHAEGDWVDKGDTILTLAEIKEKYFDPMLLQRMQEQIAAKEQSLVSKAAKKEALERQVAALINSKDIKIKQAKNKLAQSRLKLASDSAYYEAEKISFENTKVIYERNLLLYQSGNIAQNKLKEMESKFEAAKAKLVSAENKWVQSKAELAITEADIAGYEAMYLEKISKSQSDLNNTLSDLYDGQAYLAKMKNEYANLQIRNEQYTVLAPQSGYFVRALKSGIGETIKEGDAVASIMPASNDLGAEMYIKAMDLPFISTGRKVRVQFDGWPAIQFSGWPNSSVGTFGGVVQTIDRINSKGGKFRILVKPDPDDDPWPEQLRVGSGMKGWVMLDNVPIWFELWRNLNGFPPQLYEEESATKDTKVSKPKIKVK